MNAQRRGSDLRVMIRIVLTKLGRDANEIDTRKMKIEDMENLHRSLYREWRELKRHRDAVDGIVDTY